jgi:hypothetical protein
MGGLEITICKVLIFPCVGKLQRNFLIHGFHIMLNINN